MKDRELRKAVHLLSVELYEYIERGRKPEQTAKDLGLESARKMLDRLLIE
jgi:hypothetical protein